MGCYLKNRSFWLHFQKYIYQDNVLTKREIPNGIAHGIVNYTYILEKIPYKGCEGVRDLYRDMLHFYRDTIIRLKMVLHNFYTNIGLTNFRDIKYSAKKADY